MVLGFHTIVLVVMHEPPILNLSYIATQRDAELLGTLPDHLSYPLGVLLFLPLLIGCEGFLSWRFRCMVRISRNVYHAWMNRICISVNYSTRAHVSMIERKKYHL